MSSSSRFYALAAAVLVVGVPAWAAEDLRALEVVGQRAQSLEQTRRDRYECHNWAIAQTGETPIAAPTNADEPREPDRDLRQQRIERAVIGAVIGAGVGSVLGNGRHRDSGDRVLAGAAAGAAIGAATAGNSREEEAEPEEPSDYLRALTACLEGRGYSVHLPTQAELTASR